MLVLGVAGFVAEKPLPLAQGGVCLALGCLPLALSPCRTGSTPATLATTGDPVGVWRLRRKRRAGEGSQLVGKPGCFEGSGDAI